MVYENQVTRTLNCVTQNLVKIKIKIDFIDVKPSRYEKEILQRLYFEERKEERLKPRLIFVINNREKEERINSYPRIEELP